MGRAIQSPRRGPVGGYLFLGDAHVVGHVGEDGGLDEEALPAQAFPATLQPGPLGDAALDQLQDLVVLLLIDLGEGRGREKEEGASGATWRRAG